MKRVFWLWTALCLLFAGAAWAQTDATAWARATVEDLQQGRFEAVYERSDAQMHSALGSAEGMEQMWLQLSGMLGEASEVNIRTVEFRAACSWPMSGGIPRSRNRLWSFLFRTTVCCAALDSSNRR